MSDSDTYINYSEKVESSKKHSLGEKAALVLLKLFINGNEKYTRCHRSH